MLKHLKSYFFYNINSILYLSIFNYVLFCIHKHYDFFHSLKKYNDFLFIFSTFTIFYFIISFFNSKIKKFFSNLIIFFFSLLFLIEAILYYNFNSIISLNFIQILYETNSKETIEFLETYLTLSNVLFFCFISIFLFIFYFILSSLIKKLIKKEKITDKKFIIILILIIFSFFHDLIKDSFEKNLDKFDCSRIINLIQENKKNIDIYNNLSIILKNDDTIILENNSSIKNFVLILGESISRNHMSLYNYQHKTTPLLTALKEEGNLFVFNDIISPHAQTIPAIKKIFSFLSYENENRKEWYDYKNLINIMNKAEYKTFWYSNQESYGKYGNIPAAIASLTNYSFFNTTKEALDNNLYDTFLNTFDKIKGEKNFIVFHLMGAHASYNNRYPDNFNFFNKNNYNFKFKSKYNDRVIEYDNAILYNDFVVSNIISLFKDQESIVLYFPDHAEETLDFREFIGHGDSKYSKYMLEIPFLIFISDKLKNSNPNLIKNIKNSVNNPYMTDDVIHTILDILNINTPDFDKTRSIINPNFNKNRKRILIDGKDYDSDLKNNL